MVKNSESFIVTLYLLFYYLILKCCLPMSSLNCQCVFSCPRSGFQRMRFEIWHEPSNFDIYWLDRMKTSILRLANNTSFYGTLHMVPIGLEWEWELHSIDTGKAHGYGVMKSVNGSMYEAIPGPPWANPGAASNLRSCFRTNRLFHRVLRFVQQKS